METFLILLILIGLPFVWFIVRMLRFTKETVGEDSLVYGLDSSKNRTRSYHFSASQYFGTFSKVMLAVVFVQMLALCFILAKLVPRQETMLAVFLLSFTLAFLAFAGFIVFYFYVDWKFWTITRNVWVTFNPYTPSITVEEPSEIDVLTPETVSRIEHHLVESGNSRYPLNGYGCLCFYKTDGQLIWLNNSYFSNFGPGEFLQRFFAHVPVNIIWYRFPYRSLLAQIGSMPIAEL